MGELGRPPRVLTWLKLREREPEIDAVLEPAGAEQVEPTRRQLDAAEREAVVVKREVDLYRLRALLGGAQRSRVPDGPRRAIGSRLRCGALRQ